MKLRYYLRGLGIGMLVTALVLVLSGNTGGRMSDEAVKRRAAELGMVEKDKTVLEDIENREGSAEGGEAEKDETPAVPETEDRAEEQADKTDKEAEGAAGGEDLTEDAGGTTDAMPLPEEGSEASEEGADSAPEPDTQNSAEAPAQDEEQALAGEIEKKADEVAGRAEDVAEGAPAGQVVIFTVVQGDSSISVARKAEQAGLVGSAAEFDVFLCQNGYDKRISIGSYEITMGETEKEIADKITKSR